MDWQSPWHFVDRPYFDEGGSSEDFPDFKPEDGRVCDALDALTKFLKDDSSADDTLYIKAVKEHFTDEADQKSFALRLVIHYTGDIHQPFHTVSLVDSHYKKGDAGGNFEHIPEKDGSGVNELHALWDSVIYDFPGYPDLPFDSKSWDNYTNIADQMYKDYPIDEKKLLPNEFETWADEGFAYAKADGYDGKFHLY